MVMGRGWIEGGGCRDGGEVELAEGKGKLK